MRGPQSASGGLEWASGGVSLPCSNLGVPADARRIEDIERYNTTHDTTHRAAHVLARAGNRYGVWPCTPRRRTHVREDSAVYGRRSDHSRNAGGNGTAPR